MPSFVDTNVLVYAEDAEAGHKHVVARDLVSDLWKSREGVLSVQVLQELFVTMTRKLNRPLTANVASEIIREYLTWRVVENTAGLLVAGIELQQKAKLSFWDALIVQAAIDSDCEHLYSEDLNEGQRFGRLTIVNPFSRAPPRGKARG